MQTEHKWQVRYIEYGHCICLMGTRCMPYSAVASDIKGHSCDTSHHQKHAPTFDEDNHLDKNALSEKIKWKGIVT